MNREIEKAIENDKIIFFIGSGCSKVFDFPDWKGLVKNILLELRNDNHQYYDSLIAVLESGVLSEIEILEKIKAEKRLIYEILEDTFKSDRIDESKLTTHRKIGSITSKIITTNYDEALEISTNYKKIVYDSEYFVANIANKSEYILKLHGCISHDPTNCILFEEDYKELYDSPNAAVEKLRTFIADKTIIFLGFSLNDPYVKKQFEFIHKVYNGLSGNHFLISTDNIDEKQIGVKALKISDWGDGLNYLLDEMIAIKEKSRASQEIVSTIQTAEIPIVSEVLHVEIITTRIAVLFPDPIDREININLAKELKAFRNFEIDVEVLYLNLENLRSLEGFNYIFIFTNTISGKLIIEDQYLKTRQMTLQDLQSQIGQNEVSGIFIFTDKHVKSEGLNTDFPIIVVNNYDHDISAFLFKVFQKKKFSDTNFSVINEGNFNLNGLKKGRLAGKINVIDNISDFIDPRRLTNFVGRKIDIEDIVRKIIDNNNEVLTVKGSGGIGKTTLIKKISYELHCRRLFPDGVNFIDCEFIEDYQTFEYKVAQCFFIESTLDLQEHIRLNEMYKQSLIIFDNFETLLYKIETEQMKELVSFISNYSKVIITSREWIDFEFEIKHELRSFTTDEAIELFKIYFSGTVKQKEEKILREEILEKLLNNNPLAIKLIAKNMIKSKNMEEIKDDLERDFFYLLSTGDNEIFESPSDRNIERSKSLYQSIFYSYNKLSSSEKLIFELLSLFPDGIHLKNLMVFLKEPKVKKDLNRMNERDVISLENKSLIEINGGFIKLQSIIGKFASHQLNKRTDDDLSKYYERAYEFNDFTLEIHFELKKRLPQSKFIEIVDGMSENYSVSLEYIDKFDGDKVDKIMYLSYLSSCFISIEKYKKYIGRLSNLREYFKDTKNGELFIEVLLNKLKYYDGDFKNSFKRIQELLPMNELSKLDLNSNVDCEIIDDALDIYEMEGYELQSSQFVLDNYPLYKSIDITPALFKLGEFRACTEIFNDSILTFFDLEIKYNLNQLSEDELINHINKQYKKEFIEIVQNNYILSKMGKNKLQNINKLVVTNPYTYGLKKLMLAFVEENNRKANELYLEAINSLKHIKYYYLEAIYFYCKFLKSEDMTEYESWIDLGYDEVKKRGYKFLVHQYKNLIDNINEVYTESDVLLSTDFDYISKVRMYAKKKN
ncbi:SIR2 family protein [Bacillus sp. 3255]|uniref:SIR2 family protein n=1 Tax=Bacillus sp. 3255 TaxID=2817904 RepID=UPI00285A5579|nr:SIR2 family protein [Bacillus sp. 3255]MDR6880386.1 hypothetical protein [Bacillus sp. 3255]